MAIDRKQKIIKAGIELFMKKGAAFTRLNEVAKAAKVPAPLIHYYFKSIEDLHYEITTQMREELLKFHFRETDANDNARKTLTKYLKGPLLWAESNPGGASIWYYFYYLTTYDPKFKELNTEFRETGRTRISMMIYKGTESGEFTLNKGDHVADLAYEIQSMIGGYLLMLISENNSKGAKYNIDVMVTRIMKMLNAK